jgi:hypothetical protein
VLPPITKGNPLWLAFQEIGLVSAGASGPIPLTWTEIQAYSNTCFSLTAQEAAGLRHMSVAYLTGYRNGGGVFARPPWDGAPIYGPNKRPAQ